MYACMPSRHRETSVAPCHGMRARRFVRLWGHVDEWPQEKENIKAPLGVQLHILHSCERYQTTWRLTLPRAAGSRATERRTRKPEAVGASASAPCAAGCDIPTRAYLFAESRLRSKEAAEGGRGECCAAAVLSQSTRHDDQSPPTGICCTAQARLVSFSCA